MTKVWRSLKLSLPTILNYKNILLDLDRIYIRQLHIVAPVPSRAYPVGSILRIRN